MPYTVVIADDVTGANDIGIMYAKAGLDTVVYSFDRLDEEEKFETKFGDTVTVIDTNSRFLSREEAYARVYKETKRFKKEEVHQFFDKQCSVFRGNIGAEFDAMLDALGEEFAVVVLGFPDNGRQTINSVHYVHGVELKESQFKSDPVHPMTESNLVEILRKQTARKVEAICFPVIERGTEAIKEEIGRLRGRANYVILDVRDNEDLRVIAEAVKDEKIICGSSAIGYYLGRIRKEQERIGDGAQKSPAAAEDEIGAKEDKVFDDKAEVKDAEKAKRVFCIAGSLTPQTKAQTQWMKKRGYPVFTLDTTRLFDEADRAAEMSRLFEECLRAYETGRFAMVHSMQEPDQVERTKAIAARHGIGNTRVSEMVSGMLAQLCRDLNNEFAEDGGIGGFIICGGDTSGAFCAEMGIKGMRILEEIQPGLPTCRSITEPYFKMVLKSGSFGDEGFVEQGLLLL